MITIELHGGHIPSEGNVYVNGKPVCDDEWDEDDAAVACPNAWVITIYKLVPNYLLTFSYSSGVSTTNSRFGPVPSMFIFDGVKCVGTEHSLYDCPFAMKGTCGSYEGAGVICSGRKHQ